MSVKAISFDMDGTLYRAGAVYHRLHRRPWRKVLALQPLQALRDAKVMRVYQTVREELRREGEVEDIQGEQLRRTAVALGCEADDALLQRVQEVFFVPWVQEILDEPQDPDIRRTL
ncbi:hypothetical protein JYT83_01475, partial [bacterium AH-315-F18]|nr:hypothetical protein [bacterium AH-315-F18]